VIERILTDIFLQGELSLMLSRKNALQPRASRQHVMQEKARLQSEHALAMRREDFAEAEALAAKLKELEDAAPTELKRADAIDAFAKINERNRQRNLEAIRKAEAEAALRKRLERKAIALGTGTLTAVDPSARVKTVPKLFKDRARYAFSFFQL
jgi:RNA polymerase-associated protein RTF1